jgi:hypothetical protein
MAAGHQRGDDLHILPITRVLTTGVLSNSLHIQHLFVKAKLSVCRLRTRTPRNNGSSLTGRNVAGPRA